ncbi:T9SS type A sorting domain-containing protein [bacterium]|nr:MAG: T9SS type A sorting domain-containing protein [bacterium]
MIRIVTNICLFVLFLFQTALGQTNKAKIAVGAYHSVVLDENNDVYTFGAGLYGEIGHGGDKRLDLACPINHPLLIGKTVVDFSISSTHILFLTSDGAVYGTGRGSENPFGINYTGEYFDELFQLNDAALDTANIIQVLAGDDFSFFLSDNGTVFGAGKNNNAYLGTSLSVSTVTHITPLNLTNLNGEKVVKMGRSDNARLLLTDANTLYAFGENSNGQIGIGSTISQTIPVAMPMSYFAGKTIKDMALAQGVHRILTTDGTLFSVGNFRESLGMGTLSSDLLFPAPVTHSSLEGKAISSVSTISLSNIVGTIVTTTDGSVYVVGEATNGVLGKGDFVNTDTAWTKIPAAYFDNKPIVEAKVGEKFSLFRASDGTLYGSGIGAGTGYSGILSRPLPINTAFLQGETISRMEVNGNIALLLSTNGQVFLLNIEKSFNVLFPSDQIGFPLFLLDINSIKAVPTKLEHSNLEGHRIVDVKAGGSNTYLLTDEGKVFSFGRGNSGNLGLGDSVDVYIPTLITHPNLTGKRIVDVSVHGIINQEVENKSNSHTLLLADDGTVFAMGNNESGQLGVGDFQNRFVPTPVTANLSGKSIVKVVAGQLQSIAIASDGTVYMWGEGNNDYMGFGNSNDLNVPTLASHINVGGKKILDASIGYLDRGGAVISPHFLFLNEDYQVLAMGENSDGALGLGYKNSTIVKTPTAIIDTMLNGERVFSISAGFKSSMLRTESGRLFSWGTVRYAGFNTSPVLDRTVPYQVISSDLDGKKVIDFTAQLYHGLALMGDGSVQSFGWVLEGTKAYGAFGNGFLNDGSLSTDYLDQPLFTRIANFTTLPSPIPTGNLKLHLDAGRLGFITSNDSVNTWSNLADANQNAFQDNLARRAVVLDSAINHLPALRFNGTDTYVTLPTAADLGIQNSDYELFLVAQSGVSHSSFVNFLVGSESLEQYELHLNGAAGARFIPNAGKYVDVGTAGNYTDTKPHVFNMRASDTEGVMSVNRTQTTHAGSARSSLAGHLYLGVRADNSFTFYGDIAEVIIYNKVLSAAERNQVETHLFEKYAIQNYKNESASLTGTEGWRLLSSPVADSSYASFFRGLWTQGFTGAAFEQGAANVYTWPINSGNRDSTQWTPLTNAASTFTPGQGILAYIYSDDDGPDNATDAGFPKTLRADGFSPSADVNMNSFINPNTNGWSLVGNPFSTNIDWDLMSKPNLSGSVYVWDNSASEWKTWNGSTGGLTNGLIGPFNGFFVETMDASPELSVPLSAKVEGNSVFLGKEVAKNQFLVELQINTESGKSNKAWVEFSEHGLEGKDALDALKLVPLSWDYVQISTQDADGKLLDSNQLPIEFNEVEIPVFVNSTYSGTHEMAISNVNLPQDWKVELHDTQSGAFINREGKLSFVSNTVSKKQAIDVSKQPEITGQTAMENRFVLSIKRGEVTSIESQIPAQFELAQNYPNPFNPSTTIKFSLPKADQVSLEIYDVTGRLVQTLVNGMRNAGYHQVQFNASNLASGLYFYRLSSKQGVVTKKLMLIK